MFYTIGLVLTLYAAISTYKFTQDISIHFLKELVENLIRGQSIFLKVFIFLLLITFFLGYHQEKTGFDHFRDLKEIGVKGIEHT